MSDVPICGVVLAAGLSSRMGDRNKLLEPWNDKPLVRHVVDAAQASKLEKVAIVLGHEADRVEAALPAGIATFVNGDYANGMAGSIRAGIYRLQGLAAVMVLLGDMPLITAGHIDALIDAFKDARSDDAITIATCEGKQGNPVLFGVNYFAPLKSLEGDQGARRIVGDNPDRLIEVEIGQAARRDFDTPGSFKQ